MQNVDRSKQALGGARQTYMQNSQTYNPYSSQMRDQYAKKRRRGILHELEAGLVSQLMDIQPYINYHQNWTKNAEKMYIQTARHLEPEQQQT